jgi:Peptidase inhibitor family I36
VHSFGSRRIALSSFGVILLVLALAGVASASHVTDQQCSNSRVCLYEDANLGGCLLEKNAQDATFTDNDPCHFTFGNFNDSTSSFWNREDFRTVLCHDGSWLGGIVAVMNANMSQNSLGQGNDSATSLSYNGNENCVPG